MSKPPNIIKLVMQAVCILLKVPPMQHKIHGEFGHYYSYWDAASSRDVLGHPHLQEMLCNYDKNSITPEMMKELEDVVLHEEFEYDNVVRASQAAAGMFLWVRALRQYYYVVQEIKPQRDKLIAALAKIDEKEAILAEKRAEIVQLEEKYQVFKKEVDQRQAEIDVLEAEI